MNTKSNSRSHNPRIYLRVMFVALAALALLALATTNGRWSPQVGVKAMGDDSYFGAIYTSLGDGTAVNANLYNLKSDVYLNGGPQNQNSQGLPDGTYYFEVTNPNGSVLLSTDQAVCRQVNVVGGVVFGHAAASDTAGCAHLDGDLNLANGSKPVQLIPFLDTPNAGGEYKVALIRQGDGVSVDSDGLHITRGGSDDKTDNFKVKENGGPTKGAIGGLKWIDTNHDGVLDPSETGRLQDVQIDITVDGVTTPTFTDAEGTWGATYPIGASYTACEVVPPTYTQTGPNNGATASNVNNDVVATANASRCWEGTVTAPDTANLNFGNILCAVEIGCPGDTEVECGGDTSPTGTGTATGSSNCGTVDVTYKDSFAAACGNTGVITRTWTATDTLSGNSNSCVQTITIVDTTDPTIGDPGANAIIYCPSTPTFTAPTTASDACGTATIHQLSDVTTEGHCGTYSRTISWNATDECGHTSPTVSQTIEVRCNNCGEGTMGFWQNKNGQALIKGPTPNVGTCGLTPYLRNYAPFQDLNSASNCGAVATYVTNVVKAASASGAAMNAMLKAQMLSTALDVYFIKVDGLAPIDLKFINKPIGSTYYEDVSSSFGPASCLSVNSMLNYASGRSNVGGSVWYNQVKNGPNSQELAKDAFDAINNQKAFSVLSCP